jgi:signal transduction histidine kinase
MVKGARHRLRPYALFFAPFVVISALFAAGDEMTMRRGAATRSESEALVQNVLSSVQLVTRMSRDIDRTRLLVDAHIFEKGAPEMANAEAQIAATRADFDRASRQYDPIATLPGEASRWQELQLDVSGLAAPLEQTLAFSRANRDTEAREALETLEGRFSAIDGDAEALVSMNRAGAEATVARVDALERASASRMRMLGLFGIVLSLGVGALTTNLLGRRQARIDRYAATLEERNRDLDAFAGRVAHDLRGPLGTLTLAVSQVARRAPAETGMIALLRRAVARMDAIVGGLLALSRSENTADAVCDPAAAAAQVKEDLAPRAQEQRIALRIEVEPARVRCFEPLLLQVLFNLAENAMKYRRQDIPTAIEIEGRARGDAYELSVRDNGVGMSSEDARRAFEPFFRGKRVQDRPGTGLGLSIVKRVIEGSGGTVAVESELGEGTTFHAKLPLADPARPQEPA